ncbi:hypothetical protein GCM10023143_30610 [Compostibacter hankyongensis]|uniref:Uncharacterized protein n=1 Tax=Compostibacter hankyongensis TaxID=1007089 RepID=A0ABP8G5U7_9BACT
MPLGSYADHWTVKTVAVMGFLMALPLNVLVNLALGVMALRSGKSVFRQAGKTLWAVNLFFLVLTLVYFLIR